MDYLEQMRVLCEEKGITLVLIKAPTNSWNYYWYDQWEAQVDEYAATHGLPYYNFIEMQEEIGLDWDVDTYDGGVHLNVYGAEKLTKYFGEILVREYALTDRRSDTALSEIWNTKTEIYYRERKGEQ